jgi:DnaD/phage-associated family protein
MIADFLTDSEKTYEPAWIEDAITEAVLNNKRNWKYIDAILKRWKENGRAKKQTRRDTQEGRWKDYDRKIEELRQRSRK